MGNESSKIIVKVGKTSNIRFSNCKVFRAITVEELKLMARRNDDCHIVIIESIDSYEENSLKEFINDFKGKNSSNEVLFFIPDSEDDVTSGVADELDYSIYLKLEDLYSIIHDQFGLNVSILIDDKKKYNSAEMQEVLDEDVPDLFGNLDEDDEKQLSEELSSVTDEKTEHEIETENRDNTKNEVSHEYDSNSTDIEFEDTEISDNKQSLEDENDVNIVEDSSENSESTNIESEENNTSDDSELVDKLKLKIRDLKYDYSVAVNDIKSANKRIETLEDIVKALKDEKEAMIDRFNSLLNSEEVLEDPISLAEYNKLNETIDYNDATIKELSSNIESLKLGIDNRDNEINEKQETIDELRKNIGELNDRLKEINNSIESGEIHKDVVEDYEEKIKLINDERDKLILKLNSLQSDVDGLYGKIDDLSTLADTESELRRNTLDKLNLAIEKIIDYKDKLYNIESEKKELQDSLVSITNENNSNKNKIKELEASAVELNEKANSADKRIELAQQYSDVEKAKLEGNISELRTKLQISEQQLKQKEEQYVQLVAASGVDASGASAIIETNKALEGVTKTLREQVGAANKENDALKKKNSDMQVAITSYKNQIEQLSNAIKNSGGGGSTANVDASLLMKSINYTGKAAIIPIFGSGSFGTTTLAMSIAYKLGTNSKVLYLDFDMVAPKADAWFGKMPLCQRVPGVNKNDRRMTGLGIFYELGLQTFVSNYDYIINKCDRTKSGGIDYLSGVYYRVSNIKVTSADYSTLFNFLGDKYQYIIIDLGRLGSSDANDRLIKNIVDISPRAACVTNCDIFGIRSFKAKLAEDNVDIHKLAWLVNMCNSTSLDERIKKTIAPAQYSIMIMDASLYGVREKFTRNNLSKDKFELYINSNLFSGGR